MNIGEALREAVKSGKRFRVPRGPWIELQGPLKVMVDAESNAEIRLGGYDLVRDDWEVEVRLKAWISPNGELRFFHHGEFNSMTPPIWVRAPWLDEPQGGE